MIQRTYGQVKNELAEIAGNTGMPVTDARLLRYVNDAIEELKNAGEWPGVVDQWLFRFDQSTGLLTLPYHLEQLMAVTVDDAPLQIRSPWFEFYQYGPGIARDEETDTQGNARGRRASWMHTVFDRGESPLFTDLPQGGPWTLGVRAVNPDDATGQVLTVHGLDANGDVVRMSNGSGADLTYTNGEEIEIDGSELIVTGVRQFSAITSVTKPETFGAVELVATDLTTTVVLARYQWNERTPSYRRYFIPALWRENTGERDRVIRARCRRRFIPVSQDGDVMMIGNTRAIGEMMLAQYKRTSDNAAYEAHRAEAIRLMVEESVATIGRPKAPAITFGRGFSVGAIPFIR